MPSVIVHCLSNAVAALAAAKPGEAVTLVSPPWGAKSVGVGGFLAIIATARSQFPDITCHAVLDCGPFPGLALGALRMGVNAVRVEAAPEMLDKLRQIAAQLGATIDSPAFSVKDHGYFDRLPPLSGDTAHPGRCPGLRQNPGLDP